MVGSGGVLLGFCKCNTGSAIMIIKDKLLQLIETLLVRISSTWRSKVRALRKVLSRGVREWCSFDGWRVSPV
jgi:hypothetical protein